MKSKAKIGAQTIAYVKGYKLQRIDETKIFKNAGVEKRGDKYYNKETGRQFKTKVTTKNYAAKQSGYKDWQQYLDTRKTRVYKQFEKRGMEKGNAVELGSAFSKLFRQWQKKKFCKRCESIRAILNPLGWIDEHNYSRYV